MNDEKIKKDILILIFGSIITFVCVPLFMISSDLDAYDFINLTVFYKSAFYLSTVLTICLLLIHFTLSFFEKNKSRIIFIHFFLSWVILAGFVFSISASTGMINLEQNPINSQNLILVAALSVALSLVSLTRFKKHLQIFFVATTLTATIPAVISVHNNITLPPEPKGHTSLELSNQRNILVISFDGLPSEIVSKVIKNHHLQFDLKDFIFFNNAISQAPATRASLLGDIYGVQDYKSRGKTIEEVIESLKRDGSFKNITAQHIKDSYQYKYDDFQIKEVALSSPAYKALSKLDTFDFFKYPIARLFSSYFLQFLNWDKKISPLKWHVVKRSRDSELINKLDRHAGENWDKLNIIDLSLWTSFTSHLTVSDKEFSLRYMHFEFTHFPVDYDQNCNYRSDDSDWHINNQNEQGLENQTACALATFVNFLNKLKKLEIYDKSLIVLKSDHGEPPYYFQSSPNDLKINQHSHWGFNRYRPTLMVKDFNTQSEEIIIKNDLVLLSDLAKTICEKSNADTNSSCQQFNGANLLENKSIKEDSPYFIYVVKDASSNHTFDTHISVEIPSRKIPFLQAVKESELISLSP